MLLDQNIVGNVEAPPPVPGCAVIGLPGLAWSPAHQTLNLHVKSAGLGTEHGAVEQATDTAVECSATSPGQPQPAPASFNMLSNVRRAVYSCGNTIILFEVVLFPSPDHIYIGRGEEGENAQT